MLKIKQIVVIGLVIALAGCGGSGSSSSGGADQAAQACLSTTGFNPTRTAISIVNSCSRSVNVAFLFSPQRVVQVEGNATASYPVPSNVTNFSYAACYAPYIPRIRNATQFTCEK